jgi:hypothetical protein
MTADTGEELITRVVGAFAHNLTEQLSHVELGDVDASRIGSQAADWAASAALAATGSSLVARRIGPVYTTGDLTRWLTAPGRAPLTGEAVRKRATQRRLVAFRADDRQWAFPAWQFDRVAGRLVPRDEVVALWGAMPHAGFLTAADLAAWMNTRLTGLGGTPAAYAHDHGAGDDLLIAATSRLRTRAA